MQKNLEEDVEKIIPEILQILCTKIKEWYNIDAPDYITNIKTVEKTNDKKVLEDITLKFNSTFSPTSSKTKLKFSLSNSKKRDRIDDKENYDRNKFFKIHDEELDNAIEEYFKLMGDDIASFL